MEAFLTTVVEWEVFELKIDTNIFKKDIILRSAYVFLDQWYFFFKEDGENSIVLQFTKKDWVSATPQSIIWEFSDELLAIYLRDRLEVSNKTIRETIVTRAINWPLDTANFVSLDIDVTNNEEKNQVDFDKDIDEILQEIENDSDFKVDEEEINNILKEIENEVQSDTWKPVITFDPKKLGDIKNAFKKDN